MPTGTLSPIFQFAIANRVFNYNEHNGSRHQPPLSRPILSSPSFIPRHPSAPPVELLFLCKRSVQPGMASGWIIPLLFHPLPQRGPPPPLRSQPPSLPSEIFRFHDNNCRSISLYLSFSPSFSFSLRFYFSPMRAIISLSADSLSLFHLLAAPKIAAITVRPSQTTNILCPLMLCTRNSLCFNSVGEFHIFLRDTQCFLRPPKSEPTDRSARRLTEWVL